MPNNWTDPFGQVTLKSDTGEASVYATTTEAAGEIRRRHIVLSDHPLSPRLSDLRVGYFSTRYVLLDECGLIIPLWRIEREIAALPPRSLPRWVRRYHDYDPDRDFRKRPVSGTGSTRWRYSSYLRHMKTRQEIRENKGLEADLRELEDFPVRVKVRGRRKSLPTLWDDVTFSRRGDGWKNYRKTQYKA